jgi:hypothetical protein
MVRLEKSSKVHGLLHVEAALLSRGASMEDSAAGRTFPRRARTDSYES